MTEDEIKKQIGVIIKLTDINFKKLMSASKTITDFQAQVNAVASNLVDEGKEINIEIKDQDIKTSTNQDSHLVVEEHNDYDDDEDMDVEIIDIVQQDIVIDETGKRSVGVKSLRRAKDTAGVGIQSVMIGNEGSLATVAIEEESEDVDEEIYDRGMDFLKKRLGGIEQSTLLELVNILGLEDNGECNDGLLLFIDNHPELASVLELSAMKELYDNREEVFFNISYDLNKDSEEGFKKLRERMNKSELGTTILKQKIKASAGEDGMITNIIMDNDTMKKNFEEDRLLEEKLLMGTSLGNDKLAGINKNTLRMNFKVKTSTPFVGDKISLPRGTTQMTEKGYEVVKIPAQTRTGDFGITLKEVSKVIPQKFRSAFGEIKNLNKIQVNNIFFIHY